MRLSMRLGMLHLHRHLGQMIDVLIVISHCPVALGSRYVITMGSLLANVEILVQAFIQNYVSIGPR